MPAEGPYRKNYIDSGSPDTVTVRIARPLWDRVKEQHRDGRSATADVNRRLALSLDADLAAAEEAEPEPEPAGRKRR